MSPLFLFTILIPEIIVHDVSFTFIRVKQVKYSLFHGRDRTSSLSKQGSQKVRDFLGRGRTPATPTSQASSLLQGRSDERSSYDVKDCA